mgnify:CR=1 FL=1
MTEQSVGRGVAAGVEPLDQRRVSVVCRTTRVDLSLPAHLELVAVIPGPDGQNLVAYLKRPKD